MKTIIQQYSGIALTVLVGAMLLLFLTIMQDGHGHTGWKEILKAEGTFQTKDRTGLDEKVTSLHAKRKKPVISYVGGKNKQIKHIKAGEQTNLYHFFQAVDADQNQAEMQILRVEDAKGAVLLEKREAKKGMMLFSSPGKYYVVLQATDAEKVTKIQRFAIPVDVKS